MAKAKKGKVAEEKVVTIPAIQLERQNFIVEGITPLLCDALSEKSKDAIEREAQNKPGAPKNAPRDPEQEWRDCLYHMDNGKYGFPAMGFKKAMVTAAKVNMQGAAMQRAFNVVGHLFEIRGSEPEKHTDFVRNNKARPVKYRAAFAKWEITVQLVYDAQVVSIDQLVNLLNRAGFGVGVGSWRPEKGGQNGMFKIKGTI